MINVYKLAGFSHLQFTTEELARDAAAVLDIKADQIECVPIFESLEESKFLQNYLERVRTDKKDAMNKIKSFNDSIKKPKKKGKKK